MIVLQDEHIKQTKSLINDLRHTDEDVKNLVVLFNILSNKKIKLNSKIMGGYVEPNIILTGIMNSIKSVSNGVKLVRGQKDVLNRLFADVRRLNPEEVSKELV